MDYSTGIARDVDGGDGNGFLPPRIAGFRTGRLLGTGGSAVVWLVESIATGEPFALKVTSTFDVDSTAVMSHPGDPAGGGVQGPGGAGTTAGRELRLLQRFAHEHLIRVHEFVLTDQGPAVRLDYAPGGSLLQLVASRGPLPVGEAVTVLAPVAQALAYLHSEGAAHGDVSPGNILFTAEGKPLLSDLGVGRLLGEDTGAVFGTPGFSGPAAGRGRHSGTSTSGPELDTGVDVFALAAVAWFALTGRVPGPSVERAPLSLLIPGVPVQLMELIEAGLSEEELQRPTAAEFADVVLGSGTPLPVDLVGSVHESVLPHLRTRRNVQNKDIGRRRRAGRAPARTPGKRGGRNAREPSGGGGPPIRGIIGGAAGALLLLGGLALGIPLLTRGAMPGLVPGLPPSPAISNPGGQFPQPGAGAVPTGRTTGSGSGPPAGLSTSPPADPAPGPMTGPGNGPSAGTPANRVPARLPADLGSTDPIAALAALAEVRASAFTEADPSLLDVVNVADSPAMSADAEAVSALSESGRRLDGLRITIEDAERLGKATGFRAEGRGAGIPVDGTEEPVAASVAARAAVSGYTRVGDDGTPGSVWLPAETQELVFVLRNDGGGWKIYSVHESAGDER
ncbi:serine/threonine protein kinase [Arthrobacter sp. CAN_A6]|uniref:serine/threonine-protein kinase n=1 Tax=Arthrobacter sp. CAN_A6 TaxID=2787721 RepID=UPI0018C8F9D8